MSNNPCCPRCKVNINVVKVQNVSYFRCTFCGKVFWEKGQQTLSFLLKSRN